MTRIYITIFLILIGSWSVAAQIGDATAYMAVTWSPDGKYLAFTKTELKMEPPRSMRADIYIMKADGTEVKKITGDDKNELSPSWSRDGKRIVFMDINPAAKQSDIYVMNVDGSELKQITKGSGGNVFPQFSPDGKKIVFGSSLDGEKFQLYTMNADGSGVKRLTTDTSVTYYNPVWSPDGKKIVYYVEKGDRKDQIWVMSADGTNQTLLTGGVGHNFYPAWSADGKKIIFSGFREADSDMTKDAPHFT